MSLEKNNKKEFILKIAQNLFAQYGLTKTTIDDIAKMARMGKASLYYYFQNKEAIFHDVIQKESKELQTKILNAVSTKKTFCEKFKAYLEVRMATSKELLNYYKVLNDEYFNHYFFIEKARKEFYEFEIQLVIDFLTEGVQNQELVVDDLILTAEAVLAFLKGIEYHWSIDKSIDEINKNIEILLNILFLGIKPRNKI